MIAKGSVMRSMSSGMAVTSFTLRRSKGEGRQVSEQFQKLRTKLEEMG